MHTPARVLVLGATGFLGTHIVHALASDDLVGEVVGVARHVPADQPTWRVMDLAQASSGELETLLREVAPDAVVNAAGLTTGDIEALQGLNVGLVEKLLAAMADVTPEARLIHLGSAAEYGPSPEGQAVREIDEARPLGPYGATKLMATRMVIKAATQGRDAVVLRVFNPVGAGMGSRTMPGVAAGRLAEAITRAEKIVELGSLESFRDFVDARDVATSVVAALFAADVAGEIFNVGSGRAERARTLVQLLADAADFRGEIREAEAGSERSAAVSWQQADITSAAAVLGWEPQRTLASAVSALWLHTIEAESLHPPEGGNRQ